MKCYICFRLHAEARIQDVFKASMVVNGYSMCDRHAELSECRSIYGDIEAERERLRHWWKQAEQQYGTWNQNTERFADGKRLRQTNSPWVARKDSPFIE